MRLLGRRGVAAAVVVVVAIAAGGMAYASIPDSNGVIHGCYVKTTGQLRVIDSGGKGCEPGEKPLDWNQTGPTGSTGPSDSWDTGQVAPVDLDPSGSHVTVAQLPLPAGNFVISAKTVLADATATQRVPVTCRLEIPTLLIIDTTDADLLPLGGVGSQAMPLPFEATVALSGPETVTLSCAATQNALKPFALEARIVALKVGTLH